MRQATKTWRSLGVSQRRTLKVIALGVVWAWFPTRDLLTATLLASVFLLPISFVAAAWFWGIDRG